MNIPANLFYTKDHDWVRIDGQVATVGIDDYAQSQLGDIVYVDIQTEGESLDAGEVFGAIEAVKTVIDVHMPLSGTITEVNPDLESNPQLMNTDPYGKGWMIKIECSNLDELNNLLTAEAYKETM